MPRPTISPPTPRRGRGFTLPRTRLEAAVDVLNELGGLAELEERDGGFVIRGF